MTPSPSPLMPFPGAPPKAGGRRRTTLPNDPFEALSSPPTACGKEDLGRVPLEAIEPSPVNPRRQFSEESIEELAESIASQGLQQPLQIRPSATAPGRFEIVAGERRFRALRLLAERARLPSGFFVPVMIARNLDDCSMLLRALIENLQRQDLHPLDEAVAFERLRTAFALSTEDIAVQLGKTQRWVQLRLSLLDLDGEVKAAYLAGDLQLAHARVLATEPRKKQRAALQTLLARPVAERSVEVLRETLTPPRRGTRSQGSSLPLAKPISRRERAASTGGKPRLSEDELVSALAQRPMPALRLILARTLSEPDCRLTEVPAVLGLVERLQTRLGPERPTCATYHGLLAGFSEAETFTLFAAVMLAEATVLGLRTAVIDELLEVSK